MKARRQKGGIPAGRAALNAVANDEAAKSKAVDRLAEWLGSVVLVKKDFRGRAVPSSFPEEVAELVKAGITHFPSTLKDQADKFGISLPALVAAFRGKDVERIRKILARSEARSDASMEGTFKADDETFKAEIERWYDSHPEWEHDRPERISSEWELMENEWRAENPGKTPESGEVFRWQAARQKASDAARAAVSAGLKARAKAAEDRDITPPAPEGDKVAAVLESFRQIPWETRERWPTIDDVRVSTGISRQELGRILNGARWRHRNVWRGAGSKSPRGGRPAVKVSPVGMQCIIRVLLKKGKLPEHQARELLGFLGRVKI